LSLEERAVARVSKDGRESRRCVHLSRRLLRRDFRQWHQTHLGAQADDVRSRRAEVKRTSRLRTSKSKSDPPRTSQRVCRGGQRAPSVTTRLPRAGALAPPASLLCSVAHRSLIRSPRRRLQSTQQVFRA